MLSVSAIFSHHWRKVIHFNVTKYPTSHWTGEQIIDAFRFDSALKYIVRDRDGIYGSQFRKRVRGMGIDAVLTAPRSPWQNAFMERLFGSIRRDFLEHIMVLNARQLKRILRAYFGYYHCWRTHLSLEMDGPSYRPVQQPRAGNVLQFPELGGLHDHYERITA